MLSLCVLYSSDKVSKWAEVSFLTPLVGVLLLNTHTHTRGKRVNVKQCSYIMQRNMHGKVSYCKAAVIKATFLSKSGDSVADLAHICKQGRKREGERVSKLAKSSS